MRGEKTIKLFYGVSEDIEDWCVPLKETLIEPIQRFADVLEAELNQKQ